jgi:hypothetical protein
VFRFEVFYNFALFWNIVVSARIPRITTGNAIGGKECSFEHTVFFVRLHSVFRTRGVKSAVTIREKEREGAVVRRNRVLIDPDYSKKRDAWEIEYFVDYFFGHDFVE